MTNIIHEVTGLTPEEFDRRLQAEGSVSASLEPRAHRHPALGIASHAHGPTVEAARTPHTHRPVASWDSTPLPLPDVE